MDQTATQEFSTTTQIIRSAYKNLDASVWDYVAGGAESETTLLRNRQSLDSLALRPRVLTDVTNVDVSGKFLGMDQRIPVMLAPIGSLQRIHPDGSAAGARASQAFGVAMYLSSVTEPDFRGVREVSNGNLIYQLYVHGDEDWFWERIEAVTELGYKALALTVDTQVYSRRERDLIKGFQPRGPRPHTDDFQASMTWDLVARVRDRIRMPLILKGIATAEDAARAVEHGVAVVHISNHGGRQLDSGRGTIDILPEVVAAVNGKAEIVIDGGFTRGTDIIKARALGADMVAIGKLYCFGLAAAGQAGVTAVLELLETELLNAMALAGVRSFDELGPSFVTPAQPVRAPSVFNAQPYADIPPTVL
jgi:glycolate oxidase